MKDRTARKQHNWSRENRGRENGGTRTGRRNNRHGKGERRKKDEREEKRGGQEVARGVGGLLVKVTQQSNPSYSRVATKIDLRRCERPRNEDRSLTLQTFDRKKAIAELVQDCISTTTQRAMDGRQTKGRNNAACVSLRRITSGAAFSMAATKNSS